MPKIKLPKLKKTKSYNPQGKEFEIQEFIIKRVDNLKKARQKTLPGATDRNIEDVWRDCDREYAPHDLNFNANRSRFESDEETGLRSRLVKVGADSDWQSDIASPDFYVKVNTALSILVDQNPEAVMIPTSRKYEKNTEIAQGNWKNSWEVSNGKQQLKKFMFNLSKYGTAYARTYPKIVKMEKEILTEFDAQNPDKNKFETSTLIKYNDLARENLNVWQVWTGDQTMPGDNESTEEWYFEKDFSWDKFQQEFGEYTNAKFVNKGDFQINEENNEANVREKDEDTVTVGFYENWVLDLYIVKIPSTGVVLYFSPLPNDDGKLSLWQAPWTLRDDRCPYGIGLWEIISQDTAMYNKLSNMTMDQLTLSIYKMFFHNGMDMIGENGNIQIEPGVGQQVMDPSNIKFLDIPGPGQESWKGLDFLQQRRDFNSGINSQLAAQFTGKTLGQDLQAKEAALERLKTPLDFILDALQEEAYITLSWQKQLLSTPEILEYTDIDDLEEGLLEAGLAEEEIEVYLKEVAEPNEESEILFNEEDDEAIAEAGGRESFDLDEDIPVKRFANVFPETNLNLEEGEKGELIESEESKFYRFGSDLPTGRLDWKGMVRIKPQSVLVPSKELTKRMKLDLYNLVIPAVQMMLQQPQFIPMLLPPTEQIIKVFDEDVKDWLDKEQLNALAEQANKPQEEEPADKPKLSMSIKFEDLSLTDDDGIPQKLSPTQAQVLEEFYGIKVEDPLFIDKAGGTPQGASPTGQPQAPPGEAEEGIPSGIEPLVPRGNIEPGSTDLGGVAQLNNLEN